MIKVGISVSSSDMIPLVRMLRRHPDVEICWISFLLSCPQLVGDLPDNISGEADFEAIDLYIGEDFNELPELLEKHEKLHAIIEPHIDICDPHHYQCGLCEYYRKTLVRGCRVAYVPDFKTMLCALALMPAAKNLLLNSHISALMVCPDKDSVSAVMSDFEYLNEIKDLSVILKELQTSFDSRIRAMKVSNRYSSFAAANFQFQSFISLSELEKLYHDFYDDHHHIVISKCDINQEAVIGTNKTIISLNRDSDVVSINVAFDASYKCGGGTMLHIMNLMFGLAERTGF